MNEATEMRVALRVIAGPSRGKCVWLVSGHWLKIGRAETADQSFPHDLLMSSSHFHIIWQENRVRLQDLSSTNGTLVNDHRVAESELQHGDTIIAGGTRFRLEMVAETPSTGSGDSDAAPSTTQCIPDATAIRYARQPLTPPPSPAASFLDTSALKERDTSKPSPAPPPVTTPAPMPTSASASLVSPASSKDPAAARREWLQSRLPASQKLYAAGLLDPDAKVRRAALMAAAWTRQPWLLDYCRLIADRATAGDELELELLAALGSPEDLTRLRRLLRDPIWGLLRLQWCALFGHPELVGDLIGLMRNPELRLAAAAAEAFTRITGLELQPAHTVTATIVRVDSSSEASDEEADELDVPDADEAQRLWTREQAKFMHKPRWNRGQSIESPLRTELLPRLDLVARWYACLRDHYEGHQRWAPDRLRRLE